MHKYILAAVMIAALMLGAFAAVAQEPLIDNVCLITDVGKVDDGTFNQFAFEGMMRAAEDFNIETDYIETINPADYAANIQRCIDSEFDVLITVGFLMQDATLAAAEANPDVYFIGIDQGYANPPANLAGILFREDQPGFLVGAMAALMSESGIIGGVYGIDVPAVVKFRNGYEQGERFVNPDITVLGTYIDSFTDSARGAVTAETMIGEGADVIFGAGGQTGSGAIQAAAARGVYVIGVDQDEYFSTFGGGTTPGAEMLITSAMKRVDQGVYLPLQALVEGGEAWPGGTNEVLSAFNDGISFAPAHDSDVPAEVTEQIQALFEDMKAGAVVTGVDPVSGELLPNIVEVAAAAGSFETLLAAAEAAGLAETLATAGPFTVFAPTDDAFAALPEGALEGLLADPEALAGVLLYHVVANAYPAEVVLTLDGADVETLNGQTVSVAVTEDGVVLNGSVMVIITDVYASNGVIHVIDAVLLPAE